jgi:hypothetical protein
MKTNSPKYFKPYQKEPSKKEHRTLKIGSRASPVRLLELQQILEEEQHQQEGV